VPTQYEPHLNLIEDVCLLIYQLIRSRNAADRAIAIVNFCKLRGSRTELIATFLDISDSLFNTSTSSHSFENDIMERMNFSAQDDDNIFEDVRNCLNMYDKMKELPIYKKLHKFFNYMLCCGLLDGTFISFKSLAFDRFEEECVKRTHKPGFDMVHCIVDTVVFICEAGHHFFKTGKMEKFFHSGSNYEKWVQVANRLKQQSKYLNNPNPMESIDFLSFVS
jgi:hypothetical protein